MQFMVALCNAAKSIDKFSVFNILNILIWML